MYNKILTILLVCIFSLSTLFAQQKRDLVFLKNAGQIHNQYGKPRKDIDYVLHTTSGLNIFICNNKIIYQFAKDNKMQRVEACLLGASVKDKASISQEQVYYENHYYNSKLIGVAHSCKKIVYHNIYPHIDWVLKINDNNTFEYEFTVGVLGDVSQIQMEYRGAQQVKIQDNGDLAIITPIGSINEQAPQTYTKSGQYIASQYLLKNNRLSYQTEPYTGALVIDPKVAWATYYGDTSTMGIDRYTTIETMSYSSSGKIFMSGLTNSPNNIATSGAYQSSLYSSTLKKSEIFYVVMDSLGNRLYATYFGAAQDLYSSKITVLNDTVYLSSVDRSDSLATAGAERSSFAPYVQSIFLAKFNVDGSLQWLTYCGGDSSASVGGAAYITVDTLGNPYLTGGIHKSGYNIATHGAFRTLPIGGLDAFLIKYNTKGKRIWGTYIGGTSFDYSWGLCFMSNDGAGSIYVLCGTSSDTGIATIGSYQDTLAGISNCAIIKFDTAGHRIWGTYFGGEGYDYPLTLSQDNKKNIYVSGNTISKTGIASPDAYQKKYAGNTDGFIAKFNSFGRRLWSTYFGSDKLDKVLSSVVDTFGNIYIAGATASTTKIADSAAFQSKYAGGLFDGFIAAFTPEGKKFWSSYYGGEIQDEITCATSDGVNIYLAGNTDSQKEIATKGSFLDTNPHNSSLGFILKINEAQMGYKQPDDTTTNIIRLNTEQHFALYPNPATDNIIVNYIASNSKEKNIQLQLTDLLGRVVLQQAIANKDNQKIAIDKLLPGVYFYTIREQNIITLNGKLLKK